MGKRRDQIRMTEAELWDFVESRKSLQVATLGGDGAPHLTTLWFTRVDGRIVFETYSKSQKIVNLRRDPRMAVLLEAGTEYNQLRGVSMNGDAELVSEPSEVKRLASGVLTRNQPGLSQEQAEAAMEHMAAKRTAVIFHPSKIVSWDHRKLGGTY
jgi:PPOX class probable F420-dependent enzyme